jgi:hypothetical protein
MVVNVAIFFRGRTHSHHCGINGKRNKCCGCGAFAFAFLEIERDISETFSLNLKLSSAARIAEVLSLLNM